MKKKYNWEPDGKPDCRVGYLWNHEYITKHIYGKWVETSTGLTLCFKCGNTYNYEYFHKWILTGTLPNNIKIKKEYLSEINKPKLVPPTQWANKIIEAEINKEPVKVVPELEPKAGVSEIIEQVKAMAKSVPCYSMNDRVNSVRVWGLYNKVDNKWLQLEPVVESETFGCSVSLGYDWWWVGVESFDASCLMTEADVNKWYDYYTKDENGCLLQQDYEKVQFGLRVVT